jgi:hypothetical protein
MRITQHVRDQSTIYDLECSLSQVRADSQCATSVRQLGTLDKSLIPARNITTRKSIAGCNSWMDVITRSIIFWYYLVGPAKKKYTQ